MMQQQQLLHGHDILFHIIFGYDTECIKEFVHASAVRLYSIVKCQFLAGMMDQVLDMRRKSSSSQPRTTMVTVSTDMLKGVFFLLLNVDMVLKEYVCNPGSKAAFAAAMNVRPSCEGLDKMHAWSMVGTKPIPACKARGFFKVLRDKVAKQWLQDERMTPADLERMVKDDYMVA